MTDRKYRQRGYQDEPRDRETRGAPRKEPAPRAPGRPLQDAAGPKTPNLVPAHEVFRCARCGNKLPVPVALDARCARCGADVHGCVQCASFDTSARFECAQPIAARVSPKDARNTCPLFLPRTTVERQTGSLGQTSARQAFDDLFK